MKTNSAICSAFFGARRLNNALHSPRGRQARNRKWCRGIALQNFFVVAGILLTTLVNGVSQPAVIQFTSGNYSVSETSGVATITVEISGGEPGLSYTVDFAASDGTAMWGFDYWSSAGTLRFDPGQTNKSFTIYIVQDCPGEGTETVHLTLSNPSSNSVLGVRSNAVLEIRDMNPGPLDEWTIGSLETNVIQTAVTYGKGTFVAVGPEWGPGNVIYSSPDGLAWTLRSSETDYTLRRITFGNGLFVAVGEAGAIVTSTDSVAWTTQNQGDTNIVLYDIAYGDGLFVAVGGGILTSPDGITWSMPTNGLGALVVTYGDGRFVAASSGDNASSVSILTSTDGVNWTQQSVPTSPSVGVPYAMAYGNGTFVLVVAGEHALLTSPDAVTWTSHSSPGVWLRPYIRQRDLCSCRRAAERRPLLWHCLSVNKRCHLDRPFLSLVAGALGCDLRERLVCRRGSQRQPWD